jgi:hypothetical protein
MAFLANAQVWDGESDDRYPGEVLFEKNLAMMRCLASRESRGGAGGIAEIGTRREPRCGATVGFFYG